MLVTQMRLTPARSGLCLVQAKLLCNELCKATTAAWQPLVYTSQNILVGFLGLVAVKVEWPACPHFIIW